MNASIRDFIDHLAGQWPFTPAGPAELACGDHHLIFEPGLESDVIRSAEITWPDGPDPLAALPAAKLCEVLLGDAAFYASFSARGRPCISAAEHHSEKTRSGWEITASRTAGRLKLLLKNRSS